MSRRLPLVRQHLENIHREALDEHQAVIRDFVRGKHGVYALYRGKGLRYVGLASNLSVRLKAHLADRHADSWDRFSVYLTLGGDHLRELESLVVRIFRPQDNRQIGKFASAEDLRASFRRAMEERHRQVLQRLFHGAAGSPVSSRPPRSRGVGLSAYFGGAARLRATYKKRTIEAAVLKDGTIRFRGRTYRSPSGAAVAACGRESCDGWTFWEYERAPGDWVSINELRVQRRAR